MNPLRIAIALTCICFAAGLDAANIGLEAFSAELDAGLAYDNPAASELHLLAELARWPADDPRNLIIATQVARAQGLQGRLMQAHATLDTVADRLDGMPSLARIRYLLERGRIYDVAGARERAVPLFVGALSLAQCAGDGFHVADAARMLNIGETATGTMSMAP